MAKSPVPIRTIRVYHQGNLEKPPGRSLSVSPSRELEHYHPGARLQEFEVPEDVWVRLVSTNQAVHGRDMHQATGIVTEEFRLSPNAARESMRYLKK